MYFGDSPDSLSGLGIPGNIWLCRFAVSAAFAVGAASSGE